MAWPFKYYKLADEEAASCLVTEPNSLETVAFPGYPHLHFSNTVNYKQMKFCTQKIMKIVTV